LIEQNKQQSESAPASDARRMSPGDNFKKLTQPEPASPVTKPADEPPPVRAEALRTLADLAVPEELPLQVLFVVRSEIAEFPLPAPKP
jgi:hypothetical protein